MPGILGIYSKARLGLRQVKEACLGTKEREQVCPINHPMMQKRGRKLGEPEEKILEKSLLEFKKRKERENTIRDPETATREYT